MPTIPIMFPFDNNYVIPACACFQSLLDNADTDFDYMLYCVSTGTPITENGKRKISHVVNKFNYASVEFITIPNALKEQWCKVRSAHYTVDTFAKLLATDIFSDLEFVISSDVDVIFYGDISDIYDMRDEEYSIQGVQGIKKMSGFYRDRYEIHILREFGEVKVGGGLIILNLDTMRDRFVYKKFTKILKRYGDYLIQAEQDVFNLALNGDIGRLPLRFMFCTYMYSAVRNEPLDLSTSGRWFKYFSGEYKNHLKGDGRYSKQEMREAFEDPIQIHYAGPDKPWNTFLCYRKVVWLKYLIKAGLLREYLVEYEFVNVKRYVGWLVQRARVKGGAFKKWLALPFNL